jgi:peptide chain release factor 2
MSSPDFWARGERAQETVAELKAVKAVVQPIREIQREVDDLLVLHQLAIEEESASTLEEVRRSIAAVTARLEKVELASLFTDEKDRADCYFSIHAGAGGTESCDWAQMLLRLYTRWLERSGFSFETISILADEEAGIKNATLHVKGPYAFGYLKAEMGVHRLVRISPFDAAKRRHTSFASVDVVPELEEEEIDINENDLRIDTYRSSGAGGQHVNVTDSAVRITHLPTGLVVACQNERSQHKNRAVAMKILKSRLYQMREEERQKQLKQQYGEKGDIAFGSQIRSYVLQPYRLVKDHRTGVETGNVDAVLDGDIDAFIEAYLRQEQKAQKRRA